MEVNMVETLHVLCFQNVTVLSVEPSHVTVTRASVTVKPGLSGPAATTAW